MIIVKNMNFGLAKIASSKQTKSVDLIMAMH